MMLTCEELEFVYSHLGVSGVVIKNTKTKNLVLHKLSRMNDPQITNKNRLLCG